MSPMTSSDTALLIIDVQNAFFIKDYNVYVYKGDEILLRIKSLITKAREEGIPVIFVQHEGGEGKPLGARDAWASYPSGYSPLERGIDHP